MQTRFGLNHRYVQQVQIRIGISQTSKIKSWISLICAEQIWYIPKTEKIYLWSAAIVWFIHGIACDNQRYPWYISKHWYIPGISLVYAKTRKLINWYQIRLKRYTYGVQTSCIWFIHGSACDSQRYLWYISKHWYIPGISLLYAKTRKLINWYQIPDAGCLQLVSP